MNGNCCSLLALLGDSRVKPVLLLEVSTVLVLVVVRLDHVNAANGRVPLVVVLGEVTVLDNWKAFT